ncbi:spermidine/putrescine-binding protein [Bradyrhizobium japonicum]
MTTGETCIGYTSQSGWAALAKQVPLKALTKVHPTLKTALFVNGWVVMANSKNKKAALDFANYTVGKEGSEIYHQIVDVVPANTKAKAGSNVAAIQFTPQEFDKFVYQPDWAFMVTQLGNWVKKFEQDIAPKI